MKLSRQSIVLRLMVLISLILTGVFALTGYLLSKSASQQASATVEREVAASFEAYKALWTEHTENLRQISLVISRTADVRAAFMTRDRATIEDTAGELWEHLSPGSALFSVADGDGKLIVNLTKESPFQPEQTLQFLQDAKNSFPRQKTGFLQEKGRLFQVVVTPVYVDSSNGQALLNIVLTGFELDPSFLRSLKQAAGGSDLIFKKNHAALASTLENRQSMNDLGRGCSTNEAGHGALRLALRGVTYLAVGQSLPGMIAGERYELCILRSLASSDLAIGQLRLRITILWLAGLAVALAATYAIVRRMIQPVARLDRAVSEIAKGNYQARVEVESEDDLGRLAGSFNTMCDSLEHARAELIQQERLSSVARLATFVVHDLRNPLASIYAGAEMLVDNDLPFEQTKRLAKNMYQASRGMLAILQELLSVSRNVANERELCGIEDLVVAAWQGLQQRAESRGIEFNSTMASNVELMLDRPSMERVFHNLLENAIKAIGSGGRIDVITEVSQSFIFVHVKDTGRGINPSLRPTLFQPFATQGNTEGLGIGLALSRQTAAAHGGDLWADYTDSAGGHFVLKLPIGRETKPANN